MNTERLLRVARLVERLPKEQFDMAAWMFPCNTVGCAVGHACFDPWFNAEGLTWHDGHACPKYTPPKGKPITNWVGVEAFFDLDMEAVDYLFCGYKYPRRPTRHAVAQRIREFVKTGEIHAR